MSENKDATIMLHFTPEVREVQKALAKLSCSKCLKFVRGQDPYGDVDELILALEHALRLAQLANHQECLQAVFMIMLLSDSARVQALGLEISDTTDDSNSQNIEKNNIEG